MKKNILGKGIVAIIVIIFISIFLFRLTTNKDNEIMETYKTAVEVQKVQFGKIDKLGTSIEEVLVVNKNALIREAGGNYVFLIKGNVAGKVMVSIGAEGDDYVEITSGIDKDEIVVVKGKEFIKDGEEVNVVGGIN